MLSILMMLSMTGSGPGQAVPPHPNCCTRPVAEALMTTPFPEGGQAVTAALTHICAMSPFTTDFANGDRRRAAELGFLEQDGLFTAHIQDRPMTVVPETANAPCQIEAELSPAQISQVEKSLGDWSRERELSWDRRDRNGPVDASHWDGPWFTLRERGRVSEGELSVRSVSPRRRGLDVNEEDPVKLTIQWQAPRRAD
jgi:hypothetical protein